MSKVYSVAGNFFVALAAAIVFAAGLTIYFHNSDAAAGFPSSAQDTLAEVVGYFAAAIVLVIVGSVLINRGNKRGNENRVRRAQPTMISTLERDGERIRTIRTASRIVSPPPLK